MKKAMFLFATILLLSCPVISANEYGDAASSGAKDTVKGDVGETLENARNAQDEMSNVTFEETIPKPEDIQSAASECLDGILNADFGFGLNTPSIKSLFNSACNSINSEVTNHLSDADLNLSDQFTEIGAGLGRSSAPANRVNYDQVGDGIVDELWDDIDGESRWRD